MSLHLLSSSLMSRIILESSIIDFQPKLQGSFSCSTIECREKVTWVQYTELHDYLMVGFEDGSIRAYRDNESEIMLTDVDITTDAEVTCMNHRPVSKNYPITNTLVCSYKSGYVKGWNYNLQQCAFTLNEKREVKGAFFHPRLAKFITIGDNKKIYLYDEDSRRQERVLTPDEKKGTGHTDLITTACFHPKHHHELISGSLDKTIQFWDTRQANSIRKIDGVTIDGSGITFLPGTKEFITCAAQKENIIRVWDYGTGREIKAVVPDRHAIPMHCCKFLTKNIFLCGGGPPNLVRLIDLNVGKNVGTVSKLPDIPTNFTMGPTIKNRVPTYAFGCGNRIYIVEYVPPL